MEINLKITFHHPLIHKIAVQRWTMCTSQNDRSRMVRHLCVSHANVLVVKGKLWGVSDPLQRGTKRVTAPVSWTTYEWSGRNIPSCDFVGCSCKSVLKLQSNYHKKNVGHDHCKRFIQTLKPYIGASMTKLQGHMVNVNENGKALKAHV